MLGNTFGGAKSKSSTAPTSDYLALILWPLLTIQIKKTQNFKFENMWLNERQCKEIMVNCWESTVGLYLLAHLGTCSKAIWDCGRRLIKNFQPRIDACKNQLDVLKNRKNHYGVYAYANVQRK